MIEAKISFAQVDAPAPTAVRRLPRMLGLGLAAVVSAGLWGVLVMAATHIL